MCLERCYRQINLGATTPIAHGLLNLDRFGMPNLRCKKKFVLVKFGPSFPLVENNRETARQKVVQLVFIILIATKQHKLEMTMINEIIEIDEEEKPH